MWFQRFRVIWKIQNYALAKSDLTIHRTVTLFHKTWTLNQQRTCTSVSTNKHMCMRMHTHKHTHTQHLVTDRHVLQTIPYVTLLCNLPLTRYCAIMKNNENIWCSLGRITVKSITRINEDSFSILTYTSSCPREVQEIFFYYKMSRLAMAPTQPPVQHVLGSCPGGKVLWGWPWPLTFI